jgi:hypothetical protein
VIAEIPSEIRKILKPFVAQGYFALSSRQMEASHFSEEEFFRAITGSAARAMLIGRRALIALGLPLMTSDYDFWLHPDDIAASMLRFRILTSSQTVLPRTRLRLAATSWKTRNGSTS